jgi:hypothetical protein
MERGDLRLHRAHVGIVGDDIISGLQPPEGL